MEERSKARFRATRERVGLSQKALADTLGNCVDMVKRWENPRYAPPPADAWALLDDMLERHIEAVETAVGVVRRQMRERGGKPGEVRLLYYRSQAQYDAYGRDPGDYAVVDARVRETAAVLGHMGIDVTFAYPEDDELMFQALANTR